MNNGIFPAFEDEEDIFLPSNPRAKKAGDNFYENNGEVLKKAALSLNPALEIKRRQTMCKGIFSKPENEKEKAFPIITEIKEGKKKLIIVSPGEICKKTNCISRKNCLGTNSKRKYSFTCGINFNDQQDKKV